MFISFPKSNVLLDDASRLMMDAAVIPMNRRQLVFRPPFRNSTQLASQIQPSQVDVTSDRTLVSSNSFSNENANGVQLHSVNELPSKFHRIFQPFRYFNAVQSTVFDEVFNSDKSVAVCAPTGSGKTVIMELAIVSLLRQTSDENENIKIVYMAPIKALCFQRLEDWRAKFESYGVKCAELTGDTETDDYFTIQTSNLIFTTPEKWDSTTRRWNDSKKLIYSIRLFLIDEVHVLNDENRGPTLEAVLSRMLTISASKIKERSQVPTFGIRFIAVSATIPNVEDIATWFESSGKLAVSYKLSDDLRPVKLRKEVLGYYCSEKLTNFKFDLNLNYKLNSVIFTYSDGKPTLVFCSTRKGAMQAAGILAPENKYRLTPEQKQKLLTAANSIKDNKLKETIICGVGFHHAGLENQDRKSVEQLFNQGLLPVLTATSTLAMGVNMPAHLVIVKSTTNFVAGTYIEYSNTQILQMIGRAGRPQFDSSATAVIMTKQALKEKYEKFINGTEVIESRLHRKFTEFINAEIVLGTITNLTVALQWIQSTFFYVRVLKNPEHYGLSAGLDKEATEVVLKEMCLKELNNLHDSKIILMDAKTSNLHSTESGRLMARYCISMDTTKKFLALTGAEDIKEMISLISTCKEFSDIQLRNGEKRILNTLNNDKQQATIRFQLDGKIRTREMKIHCLIQAVFGCIPIQDSNLNQESMRIIKTGQRISKFLYEIVLLDHTRNVKILIASLRIVKCFNAKLWENSIYVTRQVEKIGITMATALANAGLATFEKIEQTNPREIEMIINRHAPFGGYVQEAVASLPRCSITIEQTDNHMEGSAEIILVVSSANNALSNKSTGTCIFTLIVGDRDNKIVFKQKLSWRIFQECNTWSKQLTISRAQKGDELNIYLINEKYVGLDIIEKFTPTFTKKRFPSSSIWDNSPQCTNVIEEENKNPSDCYTPTSVRRNCNHHCLDKKICLHDCCKAGVLMKTRQRTQQMQRQNSKINTISESFKNAKMRQTTLVVKSTTYNGNTSLKTFSVEQKKALRSANNEKEIYRPDGQASSCKTDSALTSLQQFNFDRKRKSSCRIEKPNFEFFLESDVESNSEDSVICISLTDDKFENLDNKSSQGKLLDDITRSLESQPLIKKSRACCSDPKSNYLSAKNVYQQIFEKNENYSIEKPHFASSFGYGNNSVASSLDPALKAHQYENEGTKSSTPMQGHENDDTNTISTFFNLFEGLF